MAKGTRSAVTNPLDDLIDRAQAALEDVRSAIHDQLEATAEQRIRSEELRDTAQQLRPDRPEGS